MSLQMAGSPVRLSVVHPGGVATNIARNSRTGVGVTDNARRAQIDRAVRRPSAQTTPKDAALRIIKGIEKNQPRILIGNDARFMDILQRFRPATYWAPLARKLERMAKAEVTNAMRRRTLAYQGSRATAKRARDISTTAMESVPGHGCFAHCRPLRITRSPPHQLIGEIADGLAVDHGVIPLAHRLEIGGAFAVGLRPS